MIIEDINIDRLFRKCIEIPTKELRPATPIFDNHALKKVDVTSFISFSEVMIHSNIYRTIISDYCFKVARDILDNRYR